MITLFRNTLFLIFVCFTLFSCKGTQTSSGFQLDEDTDQLPPGVPERVGVVLFAGEEPINQQATDQFSTGLLKLGFDVIERSNFQAIINELEISSSDLFSESTRAELGNQSGLEAIFTGSVTGEDSMTWVNTHVNVKLVDIETGRIIWAGTANDPWKPGRRLRSDVRTSVTHSVREALKLLENDLNKIRNED